MIILKFYSIGTSENNKMFFPVTLKLANMFTAKKNKKNLWYKTCKLNLESILTMTFHTWFP